MGMGMAAGVRSLGPTASLGELPGRSGMSPWSSQRRELVGGPTPRWSLTATAAGVQAPALASGRTVARSVFWGGRRWRERARDLQAGGCGRAQESRWQGAPSRHLCQASRTRCRVGYRENRYTSLFDRLFSWYTERDTDTEWFTFSSGVALNTLHPYSA